MGRDHVSELRPAKVLLFVPQMICGYGEPRWNDIDRGKQKNSEKSLSQCHFIYEKSHMDCSRASALWGRWVTAWAMSRPHFEKFSHWSDGSLIIIWIKTSLLWKPSRWFVLSWDDLLSRIRIFCLNEEGTGLCSSTPALLKLAWINLKLTRTHIFFKLFSGLCTAWIHLDASFCFE
jgi:hypothetical protein